MVVLVSWGIAFVEYCLAVPANRYGSTIYSPAQLKTMQEVITLVVFAVFLRAVPEVRRHSSIIPSLASRWSPRGAFFVFKGPL